MNRPVAVTGTCAAVDPPNARGVAHCLFVSFARVLVVNNLLRTSLHNASEEVVMKI